MVWRCAFGSSEGQLIIDNIFGVQFRPRLDEFVDTFLWATDNSISTRLKVSGSHQVGQVGAMTFPSTYSCWPVELAGDNSIGMDLRYLCNIYQAVHTVQTRRYPSNHHKQFNNVKQEKVRFIACLL